MGRKKREVAVEEVVVTESDQVVVVDSEVSITEGEEVDASDSGMESVEPAPSDSEKLIAELREQVAGLQRQFNYTPMLTPRQQEALEVAEEVGQLSRFCHDVETKYDKSDKETKSLKKAYETALKELQTAAERLEEVMGDGDYQKRLFPMASNGSYSESVSAVFQVVDETGAISSETVIIEPGYDEGGIINLAYLQKADLENMKPGNGKDGLTAKKIEALKESVGETVADLESWLQSGNTLDKIKGFGTEWVTRTMDALGVIRDAYPVPEMVVTTEQDDLIKSTEFEDILPEPVENNAVVSLGEDGLKIELVDELE